MERLSTYYEHIVGSTAAGIASTLLGHPLDTIKTHLQTNPKMQNSFHVVRELKLGGVFRGMAPPLANAIVMNTVMFSVFDTVNEITGFPFIAGMLSGFATAMISTPTDYVKIHAQLSGKSTWSILRETSASRFYRGHISNLGREGLFTMVYLGLYYRLTFSDDTSSERDLVTVALTSSLTGAMAWVISFPLDTVKTLIQSGKSMRDVTTLWRESGVSAFYKGCGASTGRAMLVTSSRMIAYEWILRVIHEKQ
jgi:solute carrier family 25 carnitine/acylcarnitine transporter 20/29